ncbi:MAG: flagellar biosynthesis protein FlhB [Rhodothalassiaceae bacterium]
MAENEDDAQKTEEPTQKRLEEAAKKGDIPQSQEVKHWMMLVSGAIAFLVAGGITARTVREQAAGFLGHAHEIPMDPGGVLDTVRAVGGEILLVLLLPFGIFMIGALAGNLVQNRPPFSTEKLVPKLDKISPLAGWKRTFSAQRVADLLKTVAKLVVVSTAVALVLWPEHSLLIETISSPVTVMAEAIRGLSLKTMAAVIGAMTVIAALDLLFQRLQHLKKMRMTRQEVRDEMKQMEGDPMIKARLRQIRLEKSRKRMMAAVPDASVVITNPTHFAVALRYRHGEMQVPVVVAKGVDSVALRIREIATEHGVPIVENPPLARALHATVDIDEEITPEHYEAVAQVIGYVLRIGRRQGRHRAQPFPRG